MNIYFVGAATIEKGINDFYWLALQMPSHKFFWYTYHVNQNIRKKYKYINFIEGLDDEKMKTQIRKMNLFISCSYYEGFCVPIAEAMLLEKPVLSYKLEEVESEYKNYIEYIECFNKNNFKKRIDEITKQKNYKVNLNKARKYIVNNFSPQVTIKRLLETVEIL